MNYVSMIFICLTMLSCKAKKDSATHNLEHSFTTECPEDGECTFEVLQNKSFKELEGGLGELYYEVAEGKHTLLKFQYERNQIPNTLDGHYIEQIFILLDKNNLELELKDKILQNVKATFARFCYCKGSTGYYKINDGNLSIKKIDDEKYQFNFSFKVTEVPQIINEIHELFTLN
ncbi:MAG: hypothetical protein P8X62_00855 [Flavobacteriaceae bacterium]